MRLGMRGDWRQCPVGSNRVDWSRKGRHSFELWCVVEVGVRRAIQLASALFLVWRQWMVTVRPSVLNLQNRHWVFITGDSIATGCILITMRWLVGKVGLKATQSYLHLVELFRQSTFISRWRRSCGINLLVWWWCDVIVNFCWIYMTWTTSIT